MSCKAYFLDVLIQKTISILNEPSSSLGSVGTVEEDSSQGPQAPRHLHQQQEGGKEAPTPDGSALIS